MATRRAAVAVLAVVSGGAARVARHFSVASTRLHAIAAFILQASKWRRSSVSSVHVLFRHPRIFEAWSAIVVVGLVVRDGRGFGGGRGGHRVGQIGHESRKLEEKRRNWNRALIYASRWVGLVFSVGSVVYLERDLERSRRRRSVLQRK